MTPPTRASRPLLLALAALLAPAALAQHAHHNGPGGDGPAGGTDDPRVGLAAGWTDAEEAAFGLELVRNEPRPAGFYNPQNPGDMRVANSDLAFFDHYVVVGNFGGFKIYDISEPTRPELVSAVVCPGGQGDVSVYGNLLFMSVEEARGRLDCDVQGAPLPVDPERFRGVRVFDLSDLQAPRQVAAVQTCRGSHTHSLVPHPTDPRRVYVYVSGSSYVRPGEELPGCSRLGPDEDPQTSLFRIEVIEVELDAPERARVVNEPRIFADAATGDVAGLWRGGDHGEGTQRTAITNHCHDITVYPEIGLAAGACSGNGILLDIRDPANPVRIAEVSDPNFAYWHSATFNNDGTAVIFTDEWGGGTAARCRASDPENWGANAIFALDGRELTFASYYKLPAPQTATENCVAHNGSIVPVPGRDIKAQAWYQGGVSVFDFTDPARPVEIAFFDRGPISDTTLYTGGYWSTYWYNGYVYGSEIARGLDVLRLVPTEHLSAHEIEAARLATSDLFNVQTQTRLEWPAHPTVAHAYLDQLERSGRLAADRIAALRTDLDASDGASRARLRAAADELDNAAASATTEGRGIDARRLSGLAETLRGLPAAG